jgi:hypothetical protein
METKVKKSKKWKYHTTHSYTLIKGDKKMCFITQLYKIGVYGILNSDPAMQVSFTPSNMVKIEKTLHKDLCEGVIKDLEFGREIVVSDETGFYEEVE